MILWIISPPVDVHYGRGKNYRSQKPGQGTNYALQKAPQHGAAVLLNEGLIKPDILRGCVC